MGRTQQTACISDGGRTRRQVAAFEAYDSSFYAHYFPAQRTSTEILLPSFGVAKTVNPLEDNVEYWLSMNLNSCFDGPGIRLNDVGLDLVLTLDVSGSMGDRFEGEPGKTKLQIAQQSLLTLLKQLSPNDSLGIVLFNGTPRVLHPMEKFSSIDQEKLKEEILSLRAGGGTEISKAVQCATELNDQGNGREKRSRRIFFLTDMEVSHNDGREFLKHIQENAEKKQIWSTVVGVGLDLGTEVIQTVSRTIGCNYSNVRNARTFDQLMKTQFPYTVTPVGFHIQLNLVGDRYRLGQGYGSPEVYQYEQPIQQRQSIELVTEFALAMNEQNEVRGGYLLFQIIDQNKNSNTHEPLKMKTSWKTLQGSTESNEQEIQFSEQINSYTHAGIRKALLLVRYTKFVKRYLIVRRASATPDIMEEYQTMRRQFPRLVKYFQEEMILLNDRSLYEEEYRHLIDIAQKDDLPLDQNLLPNQTLALFNDSAIESAHSTTDHPNRCCICLTNDSSMILSPCAHQCLCKDCAQQPLSKCPLCREEITSITEQFQHL
ncbi:unnamed protein product [Adineta ricciae]|uniref:Uncharacterized protein n=1 Tax=Adineta ricciae TaxID=249248 RepID=A0A815LAU6_ADIRI|nr:unnamed protein product [Adineta ricciae]